MPPFPKPRFAYNYDLPSEIKALREYRTRQDRLIPDKDESHLLLATWNIANLGLQERRDSDYQLLAEIIGWFDIVALQEVKDDLKGLRGIQDHLPQYSVLFSDKAGNDERMTFIYDSRVLTLLEEVGEITVPDSELDDIAIPEVAQTFKGFDRNPYFASFEKAKFRFILANAHLFFGSDTSKKDIQRRQLEAYAVGRWADMNAKSRSAYTPNILVMGDFNLPKAEPTDPIFKALTKRGLKLPEHSTKVYSNIRDDKNYDQIAFVPGMKSRITDTKVFDFDGAIFKELYDSRGKEDFVGYLQYYVSDHRILWAQVKIN